MVMQSIALKIKTSRRNRVNSNKKELKFLVNTIYSITEFMTEGLKTIQKAIRRLEASSKILTCGTTITSKTTHSA
jgi:hypothetical protein